MDLQGRAQGRQVPWTEQHLRSLAWAPAGLRTASSTHQGQVWDQYAGACHVCRHLPGEIGQLEIHPWLNLVWKKKKVIKLNGNNQTVAYSKFSDSGNNDGGLMGVSASNKINTVKNAFHTSQAV